MTRKASNRKPAALVVAGILAATHAEATTITKPHTFTSGGLVSASEFNANFDTLYTEANAKDARLNAIDGSQSARLFWASPTGASGTPSFRAIDAGDVGSGMLGISRGGTGLGAAPANRAILIGNGSTYVQKTLLQGTNISFTETGSDITINATGGAATVPLMLTNTISTSTVPLSVDGITGQTAPLFQAKNNGTPAIDIYADGTIGGATAVGANISGTALTLRGGTSTGSMLGGDIIFKTSASGTSGSTPNTPIERMRLTASGRLGLGITSPGAMIHVVQPSGSSTTPQLLIQQGPAQSASAPLTRWLNSSGMSLLGVYPGGILRFHAETTTPDPGIEFANTGAAASWWLVQETTASAVHSYSTPGDLVFQSSTNAKKIILSADNTSPLKTLYVTPGGIGIGNSSPTYPIDVTGDVNISGSLRFGGTQVCTGSGCTSISDERLKTDVRPLEGSLGKLLSLRGVSYDWKDRATYGDRRQVGLIAQDLERVFPEVVRTDARSGLKSVSYGHLVAPTIEAVRELHARTERLEQENAALKAWACAQATKPAFCR